MSVFIDDGFTLTKTIPAFSGLPETVVVYRPAIHRARREYGAKLDTKKPDLIDTYECEMIAKHVISIDGKPVSKEQAGALHPSVFAEVVSLIFGYTDADEDKDRKN